MPKFEKVSLGEWDKSLYDVNSHIYHPDQMLFYEDLRLPKRATKFSAGYDIFSPFSFQLHPGEGIKIPLGFRVIMETHLYLMILPRSGFGFKFYTRLANTVGIIDADYSNSDNEGHMWLKIRNEGDNLWTVNKGEGVVQAIFNRYYLTDDDEADGERNGGFGSTTK